MPQEMIFPVTADYEDYIHDESRTIGWAETISFPVTECEVVAIVRQMQAQHCAITTQGARTGIVAGAVPNGGHILNCSRMKTIGPLLTDAVTGEKVLTVQPGSLLADIRTFVEREGLFFPPDPTETSASIGGMVACNASGALTFAYNTTRHWVQALRVVLADGAIISLRRNTQFAHGNAFSLTTEDGRVIRGTLPSYSMPEVKSAAGYTVHFDMDLIELFIGMEGTLGIITELTLRLIPRPAAMIGLMTYLPSEAAALRFVRLARGETVDEITGISLRPVAIEYFNHDALCLLRQAREENSAFEMLPVLPLHYYCAVYTEFHGSSEAELEDTLMTLMECIVQMGGSDEDTWYAGTLRELHAQKTFRHAIPEVVNLLIDTRKKNFPRLTKLGTDMSVPDQALETIMAMYRQDLDAAGLQSVIFGHIGNNHVHVNILPRDMEEYDRGKQLYLSWAAQVVAAGGSISAEHGIGKLKVPMLALMYSEEDLTHMQALKHLFDPQGLLNPGTLFT